LDESGSTPERGTDWHTILHHIPHPTGTVGL